MTDEQIMACREWLAAVVEVDCASSLYDEEDTLAAIAEIIEAELGGPNAALFDEFATRTRAALEAHAAAESSWSHRTANDAIDDAFDDLNGRGIVAEQALGFTMVEGFHHIADIGAGREGVRGCVFYHRQDLERAVRGEGLLLAFAPWQTVPDEEVVELGREIVHVLRHHGVLADWSGSPAARIEIAPFTWQRRRNTPRPPGRGPAPEVPEPVAAPVPPKCPKCGGRGWISRGPGLGSMLCDCRT